MSEENRVLARHCCEETWARGNLEAVDELYSRDYVFYDPRDGDAPSSLWSREEILRKGRAR